VKKAWLIAQGTYRRRVRSSTFLMLTFGLPLILIVVASIPYLRETRATALPGVGYVDETGRLAPVPEVAFGEGILQLSVYADPPAAQVALQQGEIAGYLVIPSGYFEGESPTYYAEESPNQPLAEALADFLRRAQLPDQPEWLPERLAQPLTLTYEDQNRDRAVSEESDLVVRFLTPLVLAGVFALTVLTGAAQMGSAIVREKEQRAMEMIITSLAPWELVAGKVLGLTLLSLTQIGIWLLGGLLALALAAPEVMEIPFWGIPWHAVAWAMLLGVPAYFLYAILAAGLGIIAGDSQQAQQLAGILSFAGLAPLWLAGLIVFAPNGPLAVGLTLFPLTSPMISLLRMSLTDVPTWQLALSLGLILLSLVASIWLVTRIFRAAMLMYGQTLRPRQLWQALREA
jgi:ABC-2 type transport system permease protein